MNKNEIKKDLYKSKNMANFSHYNNGDMFYNISLNDGVYQFSIAVIQHEEERFMVRPLII